MEEETIGMVAWNCFAKLLQGPGRHWMCGDVAMHDVFLHAQCAPIGLPNRSDEATGGTGRDCEQTSSSSAKKSIVACDFLVVVTARFRTLYVFLLHRCPTSPKAPRPRALGPKSDSLVPFVR